MNDINFADTIADHGPVTIDMMVRATGRPRKSVERHAAKEQDQWKIQSHPLYGRKLYFTLTRKECRIRGLPEKRSEGYGYQSLISNMGYALFCLDRKTKRYTRREFEELAPKLLVTGLSADRYVLIDEKIVGLLIVDCGSKVRHLVRKVRKQFYRRAEANESWKEIIRTRDFRVIVICGHLAKAQRIRRSLNNWNLETEVVVFEELEPIIVNAVRVNEPETPEESK